MTSPLPPRLRDSRNLADLVRQQKQNGRQLDSGLLGGRWSPAKPLGATAQLGDFEDDDADDDLPAAINTDVAYATTAGQITLTLTYVPIDGSLLVFWDGTYLHPTEYVLAGQTVTFTDRHVHVGDRLEAAYWYWPSDVPVLGPIEALVLRGATASVPDPTPAGGIALPVGTQLGDLIVVANATMRFDGTPGTGTVADARLTQVGHGAWIGIATHLGSVQFANPDAPNSRHTAAVATFVQPAIYLNASSIGPGGPGTGVTLTCPTVAAAGAVLVFTEENASSTTGVLTGYPGGYVIVSAPNAATICKTAILYWPPDGADTSPAGTVTYTAHDSAYATTIGLQGES